MKKMKAKSKVTPTYTTCPRCGYQYAVMTNNGLRCKKCESRW